MTAHRWLALGALLAWGSASGQTPDEDWATPFPTAPAAPTPAPLPGQLPAPLPYAAPPYVSAPAAYTPPPPRPPVLPNTVSMLGGNALGQWKRGQLFLLGFPMLSLRAGLGVTEHLDVGLGFDSFYGVMNEPRIFARLGGLTTGRWNFATSVEAGVAFFTVRAARENSGPRWLTGRRNFNLAPGVTASYQGERARAPRLFFDARVLVAFDTEPFATDPLSGVPPSLLVGGNLLLRGGAELPLSPSTSFVLMLGLDAHFRADDSPVMPAAAVGLVTAI